MSIGDGDNETIQKLKDALREADCPNEVMFGPNPYLVCDGKGRLNSLLLNEECQKPSMPCPFCANRTELLGETV